MEEQSANQNKRWFVVLGVCSFIIILFLILYSENTSLNFTKHMESQRRNSVSKMVHLSYNTIKPIIDRVNTGELDINEARELISDLVRGMTYEDEFGSNYIFMSTYEGIMLVQPFESFKVGSNQWNLKDEKGNYIIQELVKAAKVKPEGSFVTYYYYPPGRNQVQEKLSYVMGIPEINAYIGTGMYMESTYYELKKVLEKQRRDHAVLTLAILIILMLYSRELLKSNNMLGKEITHRKEAEEQLKNRYEELQKNQEELQENHDELSAIYEELTATEEELRVQYEVLQKSQDEINNLAYFDYLTGLPNRISAVSDLNEKLCSCGEDSCSGSILFIDLDNFKVINDTFGHSYGDRVLIEVSNRLKSLSMEGLTIARIGGDEFVIIQYVYNEESDIRRLSQKVLELFKDPVSIDRNYFHIGCSIGVALYPIHGSTTEEVLKNADMAMYRAKNSGRNRYVFYNHRMGIDLSERTNMENQLRDAFENNEFELYYQPNYDIKKGRVTGFEALIRWNSPVYGLVLPYKFISIVEEMGLINKVGRWVIDKSFEFARTLGEKDMCISCNVSPVQLIQSNFVEDVIEAFDRYGLKKGSVAIEITESSLVESFEDTTEKLKKLRDRGIRIYLDDFGTGYSSLNYLKQLPIDIVKIDKCFIDDIISGSVESGIVRTIISLVHEIGLEVVAEGVETTEQQQFLNDWGCDYIQGYLISRPVPEYQTVEFVQLEE